MFPNKVAHWLNISVLCIWLQLLHSKRKIIPEPILICIRCSKSWWYSDDNPNLNSKVELWESKYWTCSNLYLALVRLIYCHNIEFKFKMKRGVEVLLELCVFNIWNSREISPVSLFNWNWKRADKKLLHHLHHHHRHHQ